MLRTRLDRIEDSLLKYLYLGEDSRPVKFIKNRMRSTIVNQNMSTIGSEI